MATRNTAGFVLLTLGFLALLFAGGMVLLWRFAEWDRTNRPEMAVEHHARGMGHLQTGNPGAAIDSFTAAIEVNGDFVDAYVSRARVQFGLGLLGPAREDLTEAIRLDPNEPSHYVGRGRAADGLGELAPAIADYTRALDLGGLDPATLARRASARMRFGDYPGAIEDYGQVVENQPNDVASRHNLAWSHWGHGDYTRAAELFSMTIDGGSAGLHAFFGRGATYLYAADLERALTDLAQASGIIGNGNGRDYAQMYLWLTRARLDQRERADEDLRAYASGQGWPGVLHEFLLGGIDETELLEQAEIVGGPTPVNGKKCEAYYYAGIKRSIEGDQAGADDLFRSCVDTGMTLYYEHYGALAELRRRGLEPTPRVPVDNEV